MANKDDDIELDEFNFDEFSDTDDFDNLNPPDNRSPTTKFTKGMLEGLKETATDTTFVKNLALKALPNEYSTAASALGTVTSEGYQLYNEVAKEAKQTVRDLKSATRKIKPAVEGILPEWLSKKLDKFAEEDDREDSASVVIDPNEAQISTELGSIFAATTKAESEANEEDRIKGIVRDGIHDKQHKESLSQMGTVQSLIARQVQYQDTITAAYQKKSLELQYRQFFATRDLLAVNKAASTDTLNELRKIVKNTGLPDYQKILDTEFAEQIFKERLFGKMQESLSNRIAPIAKSFFGKLKDKTKETFGQYRDIIDMSSQGAEAIQMGKEFGIDGVETGGNLVGGETARWVGDRLVKPIRERVAKNEKVQAGAAFLGRVTEDAPAMLDEWANKADYSTGVLGGLKELLKESIRETQNRTGNVGETTGGTMLVQPTIWDNLSRKSLVEIIPGYLSRILNSIDILRTGDKTLSPTVYDAKKQTFTTEKSLINKLQSTVSTKGTLSQLDTRTQSVLDIIDPENKLDKETRKGLQVELLNKTSANKRFTPNMLADENMYGDHLSREQARAIVDLVTEQFDLDYDGKVGKGATVQKRYNVAAREYKKLLADVPNSSETANFYANTGNRDAVRASGLVESVGDTDQVNNDYLFSQFQRFLKGEELDVSETTNTIPLGNVENDRDAVIRRAIHRNMVDPSVSSSNMYRGMESTYQAPHVPVSEDRVALESERQLLIAKLDSLILAVENNSSKPESGQSVEVLHEILNAVNSIQFLDAEQAGVLSGRARREAGRFGGFFGRNLKRAKDFGASTISKSWKLGGDIQRMVFGGGLGIGKFGLGAVSGLAKKLFSKSGDYIDDVYTALNSKGPTLSKAMMEAGEYFDAITGEAITKISDIKGAVKDSSGKVVLSAKDFASGLFNSKGKRFEFASLKSAGEKIGGFLGKILPGTDTFTAPFRYAKSTVNFIGDVVNKLQDIYVPGESEPRLYATLLKQKAYFSSKTRKPIMSLKDIDSNVVDADGNVKLTLEELARGVVDSKGNPIETLGDKVKGLLSKGLGLAGKAFTLTKNLVTKGFGDIKGILGKGRDLLMGGFKGLSGSNDVGDEAILPVVNLLERIHNLLVAKFKMGDSLPLTEAGLKGKVKAAKESLKAKVVSATEDDDGLLAKAKARTKKAQADGKDLMDKAGVRITKAKADSKVVMDKATNKVSSIKDKVKKNLYEKRSDDTSIVGKLGSLITTLKSGSFLEKLRPNKDAVIREGSWRDILAKRKAKKEADRLAKGKDKKTTKKKGGIGLPQILAAVMGLGTLLKGIWDGVGGLLGGVKDMFKLMSGARVAGSIADAAGGLTPDGKDGKKTKGKKGLLRRAGGALWSATKWVGGAALGLGKFALGTGGTILRGAAIGASALGSALASPVVLAGAAIAAVGYGGYKLYKHYSNKPDVIENVRFVSYGAKDMDTSASPKFRALEDILATKVIYTKGLPTNIDLGKDYSVYFDIFEIDKDNQDDVTKWAKWYQYRFKPIFLSHLAVTAKMLPNVKLPEVAKRLNGDQVKSYLMGSLFTSDAQSSPYNVESSPFPDEIVQTGKAIVMRAIENAIEELADQKAKVGTGTSKVLTRRGMRPAKKSTMEKQSGTEDPVVTPKPTPSVSPTPSAPGTPGVRAKRGNMPGLGFTESKADTVMAGDVASLYSRVPHPTQSGILSGVYPTIEKAAELVGVDPDYLVKIAKLESNNRVGLIDKETSKMGLFGVRPSTWRRWMDQYSEQYGIPKGTESIDPMASALLTAQMVKDNQSSLGSKDASIDGIYLSHVLGSQLAKTLLGAKEDTNINTVLPDDKKMLLSGITPDTTVGSYFNSMAEKLGSAVTAPEITQQASQKEKITSARPTSDIIVSDSKRVSGQQISNNDIAKPLQNENEAKIRLTSLDIPMISQNAVVPKNEDKSDNTSKTIVARKSRLTIGKNVKEAQASDPYGMLNNTMSTSLDQVNVTLTKSLEVQMAMSVALRQLVTQGGIVPSDPTNAASRNASATQAASQTVSKASVSMKRNSLT